jgi:hypothetical protein
MALIDFPYSLNKGVFEPSCVCSVQAASSRAGHKDHAGTPEVFLFEMAINPRPNDVALTYVQRWQVVLSDAADQDVDPGFAKSLRCLIFAQSSRGKTMPSPVQFIRSIIRRPSGSPSGTKIRIV